MIDRIEGAEQEKDYSWGWFVFFALLILSNFGPALYYELKYPPYRDMAVKAEVLSKWSRVEKGSLFKSKNNSFIHCVLYKREDDKGNEFLVVTNRHSIMKHDTNSYYPREIEWISNPADKDYCKKAESYLAQ